MQARDGSPVVVRLYRTEDVKFVGYGYAASRRYQISFKRHAAFISRWPRCEALHTRNARLALLLAPIAALTFLLALGYEANPETFFEELWGELVAAVMLSWVAVFPLYKFARRALDLTIRKKCRPVRFVLKHPEVAGLLKSRWHLGESPPAVAGFLPSLFNPPITDHAFTRKFTTEKILKLD
jgi:hypothetical protein